MTFDRSIYVRGHSARKSLRIRRLSGNFSNLPLVPFPGWETSRIRTGRPDYFRYHFSRTLRRSQNQALHSSAARVYIHSVQGGAYHVHCTPLVINILIGWIMKPPPSLWNGPFIWSVRSRCQYWRPFSCQLPISYQMDDSSLQRICRWHF